MNPTHDGTDSFVLNHLGQLLLVRLDVRREHAGRVESDVGIIELREVEHLDNRTSIIYSFR